MGIMVIIKRANEESMAGSLKEYIKKGETIRMIIEELKHERKRSNRNYK